MRKAGDKETANIQRIELERCCTNARPAADAQKRNWVCVEGRGTNLGERKEKEGRGYNDA